MPGAAGDGWGNKCPYFDRAWYEQRGRAAPISWPAETLHITGATDHPTATSHGACQSLCAAAGDGCYIYVWHMPGALGDLAGEDWGNRCPYFDRTWYETRNRASGPTAWPGEALHVSGVKTGCVAQIPTAFPLWGAPTAFGAP
eukprot:gene41357-14760_t